MPYGILKADTLTYYTATGDVSVAISGIAISGSPLISGVSGVFTTVVSGATVTGNAGQFTTITGGTVNFTNITGVSGTFTSRISGATVTGTSGQFTTITATTGVFTTSISGATISGDAGLFNTISGNQGVFNSSLSVPSGTAASPSISFNGDSNTGIYSSDADQVAISTGGSGRLFVDANGNVGIGGNSNSYAGLTTLTVNSSTGSVVDWNISNTRTGTFAVTSSQVSLGSNTNIPVIFTQANSEKMRLTSTGLGIGTSTPQIQSWRTGNYLTVAGSGSRGEIEIDGSSADTNGANCGAVIFSASTSSTDHKHLAVVESYLDGATAGQRGGALKIWTKANGTAAPIAAVTIDSSQRVGIGTTSPQQLLHVNSSAASGGQIQVTNASTGAASTDGVLIGYDGSNDVIINNQEATALKLSTSGTERARIDSSGRLLVGTSSARSNFFNTASSAPQQLQVEGTNGNTCSLSSICSVADTSGGRLLLAHQRSGTVGGNTILNSGDQAGYITFQGNDGGEFVECASIEAVIDGTPGANDMPGRLVFSTTADGASSPTERVRISQNGVVTVKNGAVAEIGTLTDGATVTPDFAANCNFTLTISGNRTLANPTNITAGQTGSIFIIQGSGSNTLSWGSYWDFAGGTAPTLSTASGAVDRVDYVVRTSTSIHTVFTANYS